MANGDDDLGNGLRVVSTRSEAEIVRQREAEALRWPLRELAANIMRVARGAGRPDEIGRQCADVVRSFQDYRAAVGHYPPRDDVSGAIDIRMDYDTRRNLPSTIVNTRCAEESAMRGALQMAASALLNQSSQRAAGEAELHAALDVLQREIEDTRGRYRTARRPSTKANWKPGKE